MSNRNICITQNRDFHTFKEQNTESDRLSLKWSFTLVVAFNAHAKNVFELFVSKFI